MNLDDLRHETERKRLEAERKMAPKPRRFPRYTPRHDWLVVALLVAILVVTLIGTIIIIQDVAR